MEGRFVGSSKAETVLSCMLSLSLCLFVSLLDEQLSTSTFGRLLILASDSWKGVRSLLVEERQAEPQKVVALGPPC